MITLGTSPVVQWLTLCAPNAGGPGSIPSQETRSCMPQLQIPHAAMKGSDPEWHSRDLVQSNKQMKQRRMFER